MNPIALLLGGGIKIYEFLTAFPMFWKVVTNFSLIREAWSDLESVSQSIIKKELPTSEDTTKLLDVLKRVCEAGLIDVPGVDENKIAVILGEIEHKIVANFHKNELPGGDYVPPVSETK